MKRCKAWSERGSTDPVRCPRLLEIQPSYRRTGRSRQGIFRAVGPREQLFGAARRMLDRSPSVEALVAGIAQLAVPQFRDWCLVDLLTSDGQEIDRVAVGHQHGVGQLDARTCVVAPLLIREKAIGR